MIVKIWPIKAAYNEAGKVGGRQGLKNAVEYVRDDNKCLVSEKDIDAAYLYSDDIDDNSYINKDPDFNRVVSYMSNSDKTKSKYVSGYMCSSENAVDQFLKNRDTILRLYPEKKEDGNLAFHLVQSFPEDIDISDEEVHQCGMELVEKIGKHQALICSHVHPIMDEEGEVHGKCKHNHILINAYMLKDKIDPEHPEIIKYHDNKASYRQLQIWNDEIALEHGFPIIRNPETERKYSWKENEEVNKGLSWKQQIRNDIDLVKQKTKNWDDFLKEITRLGYTVKEGKYTTLIAPDGQHRARTKSLGQRYSKENIHQYWALRDEIQKDIFQDETEKDRFTLKDIINNSNENLFVKVPLGGSNNPQGTTYPLSLDKKILSQQSINSYFDLESYYEIQNEQGQVIDSVKGEDLYNHYSDMLKMENARLQQQEWWANEQEKRRWLRIKAEERKQKQYYDNKNFKNSRTGQTYKVSLYTKSGRLKTDLELVFTVAIAIINNEQGLWEAKEPPKEKVREAYFGPPDWKSQQMMDAIQIAREEGIDNQFDIENRLKTTGASLSRARAAVKRNENVKNKMETLKNAVDTYEEIRYKAENILNMDDSNEKLQLLHDNKEMIENYTNAKRILHMHKVETIADISDFKDRYEQVEKNIEESQLLLDEKKEDYRRLKKLEYSTSLAQDARFCYGPEYRVPNEIRLDYEQSRQSRESNIQ